MCGWGRTDRADQLPFVLDCPKNSRCRSAFAAILPSTYSEYRFSENVSRRTQENCPHLDTPSPSEFTRLSIELMLEARNWFCRGYVIPRYRSTIVPRPDSWRPPPVQP